MKKVSGIIILLVLISNSVIANDYAKRKGALSEAERAELVEWASTVGTPKGDDNWGNYWLLRYFYIDDIYWIYNMSGDDAIVDNLISIAEKAVRSNNKRYMQELIHTGWDTVNDLPMGEVLPSWPHRDDYGKDADGKLVNTGDAGEPLVGCIFMSVAARSIIETPAIWKKNVPGQDYTYIDRARFYLNETMEVVEKTYKRLYVDPVTKAQQYQADYPSYEWLKMRKAWQQKGVYSPFNRIWHAQTLFCYLNPCLEQLRIYPERVKDYDEISKVAIDMWIDSAMTKYEENGVPMLDYPYRYAPTEKTNSEDVGHCAYDIYELGTMYRSGRIPRLDNEIMTRFANTIVHKVHKGDGVYSYRLNGDGTGKQPRNFFIQLKRFNPAILDHTMKGEHQLLMARAFEEIEINYLTNGDWVRTKSIAVPEGEKLVVKATYPEDSGDWEWKGPNGFNKKKNSIKFNKIEKNDAGTYEVKYQAKKDVEQSTFIKIIVY